MQCSLKKCGLSRGPNWEFGVTIQCVWHFLWPLVFMYLGLSACKMLLVILQHQRARTPWAPGKACESISSKQLIITYISPCIYIPTWTNKQNEDILRGQINCFTRCCDPFANLGWKLLASSVSPFLQIYHRRTHLDTSVHMNTSVCVF